MPAPTGRRPVVENASRAGAIGTLVSGAISVTLGVFLIVGATDAGSGAGLIGGAVVVVLGGLLILFGLASVRSMRREGRLSQGEGNRLVGVTLGLALLVMGACYAFVGTITELRFMVFGLVVVFVGLLLLGYGASRGVEKTAPR